MDQLITAAGPPSQGVSRHRMAGISAATPRGGENALLSLSAGTYNTAAGCFSLQSNLIGDFNARLELPHPGLTLVAKRSKLKSYISRMTVALSSGVFVLPALTPSAQPQTRPWWFYGCPKGVVAQIPGDVPGPGTAGWTQYQSCLQQNLSVSPQQSAQIAPILANEGRKVIAIRNNNSLSGVEKIQEVTSLQKQSDPQLKAILSSAQYDKLKVVRYQAVRWVTQKRLGWQ
jgi:hypothetical protein